MRRVTIALLVCILLLSQALPGLPYCAAAANAQEARAIAIVFDNSGSMYSDGEKAWCRATYAMEVFASMLNDGDVLYIYPMNPFTVDGKVYTMESPLQISEPSQSRKIRDIYTESAKGTPIESIDAAAAGLQSAPGDHKYLIVLTDGASFYQNGSELSKSRTRSALTECFDRYAGNGMDVLYLGIGSDVAMPDNAESDHFIKAQAADSKDVLSTLTQMCNLIFGRDSLPATHIDGNTIDFDISLKKLIVFVQGENVADLSVSGAAGPVGDGISTAEVKYASSGCGNYTSAPDTSLQGMMVTYADCAPGTYTIHYTGTSSNVEVYYEPDADLAVKFTAPDGSEATPEALYDGDYTVSFGMKDARTGELISSDLLGNVSYTGSYFVNGQECPVVYSGTSGQETVSLGVGDTFSAVITATYLSGYTVTKRSSDFGWPEGGLVVVARPAGDLLLELSETGGVYDLATLESGAPAVAKVYYQGELLTGEALRGVELSWDPDRSGAHLEKTFQEDHYEILFSYPDPDDPAATPVGDFAFPMTAFYTPPGSEQAVSAPVEFRYTIEDPNPAVEIHLAPDQAYFQISELAAGAGIRAELSVDGLPLSAEELEAVVFSADCGGIPFTVEPLPAESAYLIRLGAGDGLQSGSYTVCCEASVRDEIGRASTCSDSVAITLGILPLWLIWGIRAALLLLLILIVLAILHIKVLPTKLQARKSDSHMTFDGEDVTKNTGFSASVGKNRLDVFAKLILMWLQPIAAQWV